MYNNIKIALKKKISYIASFFSNFDIQAKGSKLISNDLF